MTIRAARDDDFAALTEITNYYIATTAIHFALEPLAQADLHALWVSHRDRFPWIVADEGGSAIGYAKAGTWRDRAAYQWTAEVGLYVAEPARGRGLGRALYAALFDELARRGFRSAIAAMTVPNDASAALHRAFGFVSVGVVRDAGYKLGRWHDIEFFQKLLQPPGHHAAG
jgi:phosphinothricin acetyltransferase